MSSVVTAAILGEIEHGAFGTGAPRYARGATRHVIAQDPLSGDLFVFFNRPRTMVEVLYGDRNGVCLVAKRIERGTF